ncbi:hypothetical protein N431DRAFT_558281 [Stipitochalara longipes BDJ]|nr:hypothetical protein N431DRAFT_558281 [Stipitochalara longipes BDJ]
MDVPGTPQQMLEGEEVATSSSPPMNEQALPDRLSAIPSPSIYVAPLALRPKVPSAIPQREDECFPPLEQYTPTREPPDPAKQIMASRPRKWVPFDFTAPAETTTTSTDDNGGADYYDLSGSRGFDETTTNNDMHGVSSGRRLDVRNASYDAFESPRFGHGIMALPTMESASPSTKQFTSTMRDLASVEFDRKYIDSYQRPFRYACWATKPSKQEIEQAMAALDRAATPRHILKPGEDSFDPLEWSSGLPSTATSPSHSPEPVTIKPQPLTYTTVGSVVNPNVVPQFSAPNRIQREGANRRPLHTLLGTPRYEPMIQTRPATASLPPLNMANSMQYAQQIARSPIRIATSTSSASSASGRSPHPIINNNPGPLGKQEEIALMRNLLLNELHRRSDNVAEETESPAVSKKHSTSATLPSRSIYTVKDLIDEHNRSNSVPGSVQGLEKMQTLQRLAKFDNPMKELAIARLREFSVLKSENTDSPSGLKPQEILLQSQIGMSKSSTPSNNTGELDLGYKFPPPGLAPPSTTPSNQSLTRVPSQPTPTPIRPRYPEPLTAGPPGQRQFPSQTSTSFSEAWGEYGQQAYNPYGSGVAASPWGAGYSYYPPAQSAFLPTHAGNCNSKLVDTIDIPTAAKYYVGGYPSDMSGYYKPISEENTRLIQESPETLLPKAVKDARRDAQTTHMIFEGQRRYNQMNADDYFTELVGFKAFDDAKKENPYGVIGPPKKKHLSPVETKPITEEEFKKKSIPELVVPMLEASWGTLAGYRSVNCPGSNSDMSNYTNSQDYHIDPEEEGNKSFFGEDWGKPLKRSTVEASAGWDE